MYFLEAHDKAEVGQVLRRKEYPTISITKSNKKLEWDNSETFSIWDGEAQDWHVDTKVKVAIDGKEGYISKESAEELKKML